MGYKLNYVIGLIESPVSLIFTNGIKREFENGEKAIEEVFEKRYDIKSLKAKADKIEIMLLENDGIAKSAGNVDFF